MCKYFCGTFDVRFASGLLQPQLVLCISCRRAWFCIVIPRPVVSHLRFCIASPLSLPAFCPPLLRFFYFCLFAFVHGCVCLLIFVDGRKLSLSCMSVLAKLFTFITPSPVGCVWAAMQWLNATKYFPAIARSCDAENSSIKRCESPKRNKWKR